VRWIFYGVIRRRNEDVIHLVTRIKRSLNIKKKKRKKWKVVVDSEKKGRLYRVNRSIIGF